MISDEEPVVSQVEMILLTLALVCVVLSVLSTDPIPAMTFGVGSVLLCIADAVCRRRRTGRWRY